ncbi:hypothetical protein GY03_18565 [Proteus vulgaris]|uniref:hypothetical protein n=1 Tax=Proteus TaxID=583 RepID=UPI0021B0CB58|nr:hypothetical protein [Proteus vulgaris]MCT6519281.1 hypothetical protein [Proteus vulgaris]
MTNLNQNDDAFFHSIKELIHSNLGQNVDIDMLKFITEFYFLFSVMEMKLADGDFNLNKVDDIANHAVKKDKDAENLDQIYNFLRGRYSNDKKHQVLMSERKNAIELYSKIAEEIDEGDTSLVSKIKIILIVLYRIRNNLFHGAKLEHNLNIQNDLFTNLNNALKIILK